MPDAALPPEYYNFLDALKKRYAHADALAHQRKFADAIRAFQACFEFAAQQRLALLIEQFVDLWMRIAFCYADLNRPDEALRIYHVLEQVLMHWVKAVHSGQAIDDWMREHNAELNWEDLIPAGVTFLIPQSFDPRPALAAVYDSMGLAYDNSNRLLEALTAYQQAIEWNTQLGKLAGVAQTWKYRAAGCQRRQEWPALQQAAEGMLAAYQSLGDLNGLLDAYTTLFLAYLNQRDLLRAIENLRQAIDLEREAKHPFLARDQKTLADVLAGLRRTAAGNKPAVKPFPAALLQPSGWEGLITKASARALTEKNKTRLVFTLHTQRFEEAAQLLKTFRLSITPTGIPQLRALPPAPDIAVPSEGHLLLSFTLDDLAAFAPLAQIILPKNQLPALAQANASGGGFSVMLEGPGGGLLAKPRTETFRFEPYALDWEGWEGIALLVRVKWRAEQDALDSVLESLHNRLERGPAAGLHEEIGFLYRLRDDWEQAIYWYQQEVRLHLRPDGRLGPGAARALCNLGVIYKKRAEVERALACFKLALHLNPNYYEAIVSAAGLQPDLSASLQCLARLHRLRADDQLLTVMLRSFCGDLPLASEELLGVIRAASADVDLAAPLAPLAVDDPGALLKTLMAETFVEQRPEPLPAPTPHAAPEPGFDLSAPLRSLDDAARVLHHFGLFHYGLAAQPVTIEEMLEYRKDVRGQLTTANTPGAVLPLSQAPELLIRVTLSLDECTVRLMQEFQLPNTNQTALKAVQSEHIPALGHALLGLLNEWVTRGVLVKQGQQLRYGGPPQT